MKRSESDRLFEHAQTVIPGGVNSPVRAFRSVGLKPLFITKAQGAYIHDADGNAYLDYVGSWGPMILGHAHPAVVEAVRQAAGKGLSYGAPTEAEILLAEKVISAYPSVEMIRMVNSGTEATMSAVRVARAYTGRDKIIKFTGHYHGHADYLLVKAGSGATTLGIPNSAGVPQSFSEHTLLCEFNDFDTIIQITQEEYPGEIACIILEPFAGNMGFVPPVQDFLKKLRALCDREGIILIFDEVMTGFRVAKGGAQEVFSVIPDMTTFGKIIGGGMPVGAYGGKKEIMSMVAPLGSVYQAGTLSGNPLAMAAGLATLNELFKPGMYDELARTTGRLTEGIRTIAQKTGTPMTVDHCGSMFGFFFSGSPIHSYEQALACDTARFNRFFAKMLEEEIYLAPSAFEAGFVSLAHTTEDIDKTLSAFENILRFMAYQVLARKLRPTKFSELIGQEFIARALQNSIRREQAAHAFLFIGSRGVGKTSCARILTKALNCTQIQDGEPCNTCETCREINAGNASDVYEIDAASNRGIEHIRDLRENARYMPVKYRYKVYIIDEAHMLTLESFNALLKTLEEPPPHVKFILATTDAHKIPRTVFSRCQHFDFRRIPTERMKLYLENICKESQVHISGRILHMIAVNSMGGLRDALTSLEMVFNFADSSSNDNEIISLLGWSDPDEITGIIEAAAEKDGNKALEVLHGMTSRGLSLNQILSDLLILIKNLTQFKEFPPKIFPDTVFDRERFNALLDKVSVSELIQYFNILLECELVMRKSSYAMVCMEIAVLKICRAERLTGLNEIVSFIRQYDAKALNIPFKPLSDTSAHPGSSGGKHKRDDEEANSVSDDRHPFAGNQSVADSKQTDTFRSSADAETEKKNPEAASHTVNSATPKNTTATPVKDSRQYSTYRASASGTTQDTQHLPSVKESTENTVQKSSPNIDPGANLIHKEHPADNRYTHSADDSERFAPADAYTENNPDDFPAAEREAPPASFQSPSNNTNHLYAPVQSQSTLPDKTNEAHPVKKNSPQREEDTEYIPASVREEALYKSGYPDELMKAVFEEEKLSACEQRWIEFISYCYRHFFADKEHFILRGFLKYVVPLDQTEDSFTIGITSDTFFNDRAPEVQQKITDWLSKFLGHPVKILTRPHPPEDGLSAERFEQKLKSKAYQAVLENVYEMPAVKMLTRIFPDTAITIQPQ
ncbi:hypothetical protein CHS0354_035236 [Potamilus streckersoni]|uniref:glutamate-1-semialdehyde 2,1-aminomutase n=1 Tax=Potamilus streckersoni TaxID=2493646 RepID=A0AAE0S2L9_9BIVA|nr:hypothetical protein CHS0354_035236 [Potamilus streckersoni]